MIKKKILSVIMGLSLVSITYAGGDSGEYEEKLTHTLEVIIGEDFAANQNKKLPSQSKSPALEEGPSLKQVQPIKKYDADKEDINPSNIQLKAGKLLSLALNDALKDYSVVNRSGIDCFVSKSTSFNDSDTLRDNLLTVLAYYGFSGKIYNNDVIEIYPSSRDSACTLADEKRNVGRLEEIL